MKRPKDPRTSLKLPSKTRDITGHHSCDATVHAVIHTSQHHIPPGVSLQHVTVESSGFRSTLSLSWIQAVPNEKYNDEMELYNAAIAKYEEDVKKFEQWQKDKNKQEAESLKDEISRLERRLVFLKERQLTQGIVNE